MLTLQEIPWIFFLILLSVLQTMEMKWKQDHRFSFQFISTMIALLHLPLSVGLAF